MGRRIASEVTEDLSKPLMPIWLYKAICNFEFRLAAYRHGVLFKMRARPFRVSSAGRPQMASANLLQHDMGSSGVAVQPEACLRYAGSQTGTCRKLASSLASDRSRSRLPWSTTLKRLASLSTRFSS